MSREPERIVTVEGNNAILDFYDEDDMASNDAEGVSSQQAIKAYADTVGDLKVTQGQVTVNFTGYNNTFTLTAAQARAISLYCLSASAACAIIAPTGATQAVINKSGQTLTYKVSAGATGDTIGNDNAAWVSYIGTDYRLITSAQGC